MCVYAHLNLKNTRSTLHVQVTFEQKEVGEVFVFLTKHPCMQGTLAHMYNGEQL